MLCGCCGLYCPRNRKINIVLGETRSGGGEEMGWKCFQDVENQILLPSVSALLALIVASPSVSCQPKGKSLDTAKQQEAKLRMLQEKSPKLTQKTDSVKKSLQLHTTKNLLRKLILQKLSDLKSH